MSKILMGSKYFFSCYPDFVGKDTDEIEIVDTTEFKHKRHLLGKDRCLFVLKRQTTKDDYINLDLKSSVGMVVGKYLVPEFCNEIGFTVEDLPKVKPLLDRLDIKHLYEKIIYDSYIENGSFTLTDEQRDRAYKSYRQSRGI
jgi:hypothetical protein